MCGTLLWFSLPVKEQTIKKMFAGSGGRSGDPHQ